jgi:hypothetical protein
MIIILIILIRFKFERVTFGIIKIVQYKWTLVEVVFLSRASAFNPGGQLWEAYMTFMTFITFITLKHAIFTEFFTVFTVNITILIEKETHTK